MLSKFGKQAKNLVNKFDASNRLAHGRAFLKNISG